MEAGIKASRRETNRPGSPPVPAEMKLDAGFDGGHKSAARALVLEVTLLR